MQYSKSPSSKPAPVDDASAFLSKYSYSKNRHFPALRVVKKSHEHNMRVSALCRQRSQALLTNYERNKQLYRTQHLSHYDQHIAAAAQSHQYRKKKARDSNRSKHKRNSDNLAQLEKALEQRRQNLAAKEEKMMQQSFLRRENYTQSLHDSFHRSQDKLHQIRQRQQNQSQMSQLLFTNYHFKVEQAQARRDQSVKAVREALREKSKELTQFKKAAGQDNRKEKGHLKQLIAKYHKVEDLQTVKQQKTKEWLHERKEEETKHKEKQLKKKVMLQQNREQRWEEEHRRSLQKQERAEQHKQGVLCSISNSLQEKRRLKDRQKLNVTMDGWRAEERRLQGLNVKHQMASSLYCAFKEEKERLREANLVQSYLGRDSLQ